MWGGQEAGRAMEYVDSESYSNNLPKLIDFFKCESTPLRSTQDHRDVRAGEAQADDASFTLGIHHLHLGGGSSEVGNGVSRESRAIADGGRSLKLEPPSSCNFVDFLGGNGGGDYPNVHRQPAAAAGRSSCDEAGKHLATAPKSTIQEAVTSPGDQWSSIVTTRHSLPNLILKLLSPSPTGTQASATSPPKTPTFDMELNSRTRGPTSMVLPDHEGESSTISADSDRPLTGTFLADPRINPAGSKLHFHGDHLASRVHRWSPKNGQKRQKLRSLPDDDDVDDDEDAMVEQSNVESRCERDEEEAEAVVQAAASLLTLSSTEDDWQPTSSALKPNLRRSRSSSSALAGTRNDVSSSSSSLAAASEGESWESGSIVGCSSVLSRPSNKRRYRLVVDVLAESPRVR